jgi:hypothetical protein
LISANLKRDLYFIIFSFFFKGRCLSCNMVVDNETTCSIGDTRNL